MSDDLSRLSDQNIEDPILRASFYRIILDYIDSKDAELETYTIKIDEEYRPDLASYRAFASSELHWLICLLLEVDDPVDGLPVGEEFDIPSAAWVRREMRSFMDDMGL